MTRQMLFHQLFEHVKIIGVFDLVWQSVPVVNGSIIKGKSSLALGLWNSKIKWPTPGTILMHRWYSSKMQRKKYTSGPRYWNVPVLVNTGTFLVYQYCLKMWYLRSLEHADVIQEFMILERKNGLVLFNTRVPVSGTWSILFPMQLQILRRNVMKNFKNMVEF